MRWIDDKQRYLESTIQYSHCRDLATIFDASFSASNNVEIPCDDAILLL